MPFHSYQSNPLYHGYQRSSKRGVYQVTDKDANQHPDGFHTTFEQEDKKFQYPDKGFDKLDANFIGIKSSYEKSAALFSSTPLLHKHLKNGYISSFQLLLPVAPVSISHTHIITSKYVVPAMGSGLVI